MYIGQTRPDSSDESLRSVFHGVKPTCFDEQGYDGQRRQFECENAVLQVIGVPISTGHNAFEGDAVLVWKDGNKDAECLFGQDWSHDNRKGKVFMGNTSWGKYSYGICDSVEEAEVLLRERYGDAHWTETEFTRMPYNKQEKRPAALNAQKADVKRLIWYDMGKVTSGEYKDYHSVVFAQACDNRACSEILQGKGVANPYLINREVGGRIRHEQLVSPFDWNQLQIHSRERTSPDVAMAFHSRAGDCGMIYARVSDKGVVNLSHYDSDWGLLSSSGPDGLNVKPFSCKEHQTFVRESAEYEKLHQSSIIRSNSGRRLPDMPIGSTDGKTADMEFK